MAKIVIGDAGPKDVKLDLDVLLRTRLLIQANSGKGKSWLLRRIAEQLFGKVQVIIIDPEGEFATLREKFDYVLVGKGGETAAHPKIAAMTAQRLLELRACAVCDLYEMKPSERHAYVKVFIEALIDAPKSLWHPLVLILDEAHVYCPEKGAGESEASEAVIGMATRGRKRGYCLVAATQRLGKLRKDMAAELLNVAIGGTFMDIDRKRAADALGVYGQELHPFFDEIRSLERGKFYFLGPAVSDNRMLVNVGPVETSHPEAGSAKHASEPPPTPDKIKALLPKLADLPKEAEEKAKSIADLQKQVRELKTELKHRPTDTQQVIEEKIVEVPVLKPEQVAKLTDAVEEMKQVAGIIASALASVRKAPPLVQKQITRQRLPLPAPPTAKPRMSASSNGNESMSGPLRKILSVLATHGPCEKNKLAILAGYSVNGGAFNNPVGNGRTQGWITPKGIDPIAITDAGVDALGEPDQLPEGEELWDYWMRSQVIGHAEREILRVLRENGQPMTKQEIAAQTVTNKGTPYDPDGGAFSNPLGKLRTLGLVEGYGAIQLCEELAEAA